MNVGFLPLLLWKKLPFSMNLFPYFFKVWVLGCHGFASVGAHQNQKLIMWIPQKYRNRHSQFSSLKFLVVSYSYMLEKFVERTFWSFFLPSAEADCVRCLMDVPEDERTFKKPISSKALKEARLIDPSGVSLFLTCSFDLSSYFCFWCGSLLL